MPEELNKYVLDPANGLVQQKQVNSYKIQVYNKPTDLLVQQEIMGGVSTAVKIDSLRKNYSQYYYFNLELSHDGKEALEMNGNRGQFGDMLQTLSFRMDDYVNLTTSANDTIPVADFILNRTYGFSDATGLLFVFNRGKSKDTEWIQFNLNEFGLGVGNQRFRFKAKDLNRVPLINFATR